MLRYNPKCLYALNHSFPFSSNGYASRSHGVATSLLHAGIDVIAACRPGIPWDKDVFAATGPSSVNAIDGVRYLHTRAPSRLQMPWAAYADRSTEVLAEMMRVFKPGIVMAASNWQNAWPAMKAAQQLGLPFFYEVRGFWEISELVQRPGKSNSAGFEDAVAAETSVARQAERVFTLNRFMRDELVRRGVSANRIDIVPNGFAGWAPAPVHAIDKENLRLKSKFVAGYIGSFNAYEGLELLVQACANLRRQGVDVGVLLVGSGDAHGLGTNGQQTCTETRKLMQLAADLGIADHVTMPGRVPADQAAAYYAVLDVVVIPRKSLAVCELVPPLKPFEAASHGKRVLMSDVAPLLDLAPLSKGFSYFTKGSLSSLTQVLGELLQENTDGPIYSEELAQYTWQNNVKPMVQAFEDVLRLDKVSV
jgi:glycosyltransferase involved in cell wall biosynthesis